jgi:hypothetical protein
MEKKYTETFILWILQYTEYCNIISLSNLYRTLEGDITTLPYQLTKLEMEKFIIIDKITSGVKNYIIDETGKMYLKNYPIENLYNDIEISFKNKSKLKKVIKEVMAIRESYKTKD